MVWDIAITPDVLVFSEGNSLWEVFGTQAAVGGLKHIEKYFPDIESINFSFFDCLIIS